jgi:hypothetical protein
MGGFFIVSVYSKRHKKEASQLNSDKDSYPSHTPKQGETKWVRFIA